MNNKIILPALALASATPDLAREKAADKPVGPYNVVFFICDQMSARALSMWDPANTTVSVPNMERLAREGATFLNSVCVVPFSSPSRASLITGMYPNTHGIITNIGGDIAALDHRIPTTEGFLHRHGYITGQFGKWHLGEINDWECYKTTAEDQRYLFNEKYAAIRAANNHTAEPARPGEVLTDPNRDQGYGFYQMDYMYEKTVNAPNDSFRQKLSAVGRFGVPVDLDNWTLCNTDGIEFIKANKERPFMATISLEPPHLPFAVQEPYYSRVRPEDVYLPESARDPSPAFKDYPSYKITQYVGEEGLRIRMRSYYAEILYIDDMLGRVLDALDELDLTDKTLVVFTSDHGDPIGSHGMLFDKLVTNFIEELTLTPTFMRLPGVIPAGRVVQAHFSTVDFAPTILDYLGYGALPSMQGTSIKPVLDGTKRDEVGFAVSMRPYGRLIRAQIDGKLYAYSKMFSVKNNKVIAEELFNITDDQFQRVDQTDNPKYAAIKRRLIAKYNKYAELYGDCRMEELPSKGLLTTGNLPAAQMK